MMCINVVQPTREPIQGTDLSISPARANLYALALALPLVVVLILAYDAYSQQPLSAFRLSSPLHLLLLVALLVAGIFLHELIHALGWARFGQVALKRIRFGFQVRTLTPYAHAIDPMPAKAYRIGTALPAILLGVIPFVFGAALSNPGLAILAIVFSFAAVGDLIVLWMTRHVEATALVLDHPSRAGCIVLGAGHSVQHESLS